jgi:beta-phosphoglucomutase
MSIQAILLDFNGTIIDDEVLHHQLIDELLLGENLRPTGRNYRQTCLGKSDRACILDLMAEQGRSVTDRQLQQLLQRKSRAYQQRLQDLEELPIYPDLPEFLEQVRAMGMRLGIVTGAMQAEVEQVLDRAGLQDYFTVIVAAEAVVNGKPDPAGYLLAAENLGLAPLQCLAIEDTFAGLQAARAAQMPVVGIAHTYPFHMLQRRADWVVDCFADLEMQRIQYQYHSDVA